MGEVHVGGRQAALRAATSTVWMGPWLAVRLQALFTVSVALPQPRARCLSRPPGAAQSRRESARYWLVVDVASMLAS